MPALEKADKIPFGGLLQEIQPCAAKHRESCQARKGAAVRKILRVPRGSWVSRRRLRLFVPFRGNRSDRRNFDKSLDELLQIVKIRRVCLMNAFLKVILQNFYTGSLHGLPGRGELQKYIVAGFFLDDHPLDSPKLALYTAKSVQHGLFVLRQVFQPLDE